jgi:hypothetical protein
MIKDILDFSKGKHHRQVPPLFSPDRTQFLVYILVQDMAIEEDDGIQGLVLRRSGNLLVNRQVAQEVLEISSFKLMRPLFTNKAPEIPQPDEVGLFCAKGPVPKPEGIAHLFFKMSPPFLMGRRFIGRRWYRFGKKIIVESQCRIGLFYLPIFVPFRHVR